MRMAANSSPTMLPVSNPHNGGAGETPQYSAFRIFFSGITQTVRCSCRPWPEFLDRSSFSKPESISEATIRLRWNYGYFRINYLVIIAAVIATAFLTNPFSLVLLAGLIAAWLFFYIVRQPSDPPIALFGYQLSDRESLAALIVSTLVVVFLTSVGKILASAVVMGVAIVCAHGAFKVPGDVLIGDAERQDRPVTNYKTFSSGGAAPAVARSPRPVASKP